MKKRFFTKSIVVLTIIALLLPCVPVIASAETIEYATYTPDSSWYGNGNATEFTISTPEQLAYFMQLGAEGVTFLGKFINLGADIVWNDGVATAEGFTPSAKQGNKIYKWTPYAQSAASNSEFKGNFNGRGYTISGLYVESNKAAVGFIGTGRNCTIQNVTFDNAYVAAYGNTNVADVAIALGRYYGNVTLTNVHTSGHVVTTAKGDVAQFTQAGSLVGGSKYHTATLTMTGCTASGSVEGRQFTGGLVGSVWANTASLTTVNLTMTDCINYASVSGQTNLGGLVGNLASGASFTRCISFGAINQTSAALGSGSLVAIRFYRPAYTDASGTKDALVHTVPTTEESCAQVSFTDCFYAPNANSSNDAPVAFVNLAQCGHKIVTAYSDYSGSFKELAAYPTHASVTEAATAYRLAQTIKEEAFKAYENGAGMLQAPAKGTDAVKIEGVQTKVENGLYAARFIASMDLSEMAVNEISEVLAMGFQIAILNDYAVNGAAKAVKEKDCASAYTSIKSNYGMETVNADYFDGADYIATLVVNNIPSNQMQTLLVRSYYTTVAGETYYSAYVAFSFIQGKYAGSAAISTVKSDSDSEQAKAVSFAVDYGTEEYDLRNELSVSAQVVSVASETKAYNGTVVPLDTGANTFYVSYTENNKLYTKQVSIGRRSGYIVTFNSSGGSYIPARQVAAGTVIEYDASVTPTRAGCTFQGWYTEEGTRVSLSSTPINEDTVWVAHWSAPTSADAPVLDSNGQLPYLTYTTSSAALNVNWKDYGNAFAERPTEVYCTLTNTDTGVSYQVKVTQTGASFVSGKPTGATISQGAGRWTVKIENLSGNYTFTQNALEGAPYTSHQSGTTVTNTYTNNYDPLLDDTAELYTANGRFYDMAGNVVTLKGVVTVNVGTVNFAGNTSKASLERLKSEGVNCLRITMQISDSTASNVGFLTQSDGTAQTTERKNELMAMLKTAINTATALGMYCIVDWGVMADNPQNFQNAAIYFFNHLATEYQNNPYVIYEICNEPIVDNGTWNSTVKPYSEAIIDVIRAAGSPGIVLVSPNASATKISDQNVVSNGRTDDPVDYPVLKHNVAYSFHVYAYTYEYTCEANYAWGYGWRLSDAINAGLTVVVTEFSPAICNKEAQSTGGSEYSIFEAKKYLNVFLENDVSYLLFRYTSTFDTYETSSQHMFLKGNNASLNDGSWTWSQLTDCGKWFVLYTLRSDGYIAVADFTPHTPS